MGRVFTIIFLCFMPLSQGFGIGLRDGLDQFVEAYGSAEWRRAGDVWLELGGVYEGEPEWRVCIGHYSGAAALSLLFSGRAATALEVIEAGVEQSPLGVTPWLRWLRAVSLEVVGRLGEARQEYVAIAAECEDPAVVMLSRLRAAVVGREETELEAIAAGENLLPSLRHVALFHLLLLLVEGERFTEAAEWVVCDRPTAAVIARPGLWGWLMRSIVIGCREQGGYAPASLVADRIQPPQLLLHHLQVRRRGLEEGLRGGDGTLRGSIRAEHMRRIWIGLADDERLIADWQADWVRFQLWLAEVYAAAGRVIEAEVLYGKVFKASGGRDELAERALVGLLGVAAAGDCEQAVDGAFLRHERAFPAGELRGEAVALHAWWSYRRGRDMEVRASVKNYLAANPREISRLPRLLLLSAHAAIRMGDIGAARVDLSRVLASGDPWSTGRARLAEALCTALEGDLPGALLLITALRKQPDVAPALRIDAYREELRLLQLAGRWPEALALIEDYRSSMEGDFPWLELALWEGDVHLRLGDPQAALRAYSQVPPDCARAYPAAVVRRARLLQQSAAWHELAGLMVTAFEGGVFNESLEAVEALWLWLCAEVHRGGDQWQPVYHRWMRLIAALPPAVDTLVLWRRLEDAGWLGGVGEDVDNWYRQQVEGWGSHGGDEGRGRLVAAWVGHRLAAGRREGALELICEWTAQLDPKMLAADVLAVIGRGLADIGDPHAADFLQVIDETFPNSRQRAVADVYFGERALANGDYDLARQRFQRAKARAMDSTVAFEAIEGMARAAQGAGDRDEAMAILERLLGDRTFRGRPHARALLLLGQLGMEEGDAARGRGYLQRLILLYGSQRDLVHQAEAALENAAAAGGAGPENNHKEAG